MASLFDFHQDNSKKSNDDTITLKQGIMFKKAQKKNISSKTEDRSRCQPFLNSIKEGFEPPKDPSSSSSKKRADLINEVDNNVINQVQQLKDLQTNYNSVLNQYNTSLGNLNNATNSYVQETNNDMSLNYSNTNVFVSTLASDPSTITGTYKGSYNTPGATGLNSVGTGFDYASCKSSALNAGYSIFGLQNTDINVASSSECVGTNDITSANAGGVYKPSCVVGSDGNMYGAGSTNALYSIDLVNKSTNYTGCYKDDPNSRAMVSTGPNMESYSPVFICASNPWGITSFIDRDAQLIWYTENAQTNAPVNVGNPMTLIYNYENTSGAYMYAVLHIICDDMSTIYLNSNKIGVANGGWDNGGSSANILQVRLGPGSNFIQAAVENGGGPACFILTAIGLNQNEIIGLEMVLTGTFNAIEDPTEKSLVISAYNNAIVASTPVLFHTDSTWKWTNIPPSQMILDAQNYSFDTCKAYATQNDYQYFGLQNGTTGTAQCFVSNDANAAKKYGSADNSFKMADGNMYGGTNVTALYDTGLGSSVGLLGKMGYVDEKGNLSEYPVDMFNATDINNITLSNNASCNKSVNKIDTKLWASYANAGSMMSLDTICGLSNATATQVQQTEALKQQLSVIAQQIVDKIIYLETLNVSMLDQMGMDRTTLNDNLTKYKQVITQFNNINSNQGNINEIIIDTETNVLMENYNYMFWGILALIIVIITIHSTF